MIDSAPFYWLVCDGCKVRIDYGDFVAWESEDQAVDVADDWTTSPDGQRHHCPACPPLDVEDESEVPA